MLASCLVLGNTIFAGAHQFKMSVHVVLNHEINSSVHILPKYDIVDLEAGLSNIICLQTDWQ